MASSAALFLLFGEFRQGGSGSRRGTMRRSRNVEAVGECGRIGGRRGRLARLCHSGSVEAAVFALTFHGPPASCTPWRDADSDVFPDSQHFLMSRGADSEDAREIVLVQHWFEELKHLVPTK